jgi:hypothetical protein
VITGGQEVAAEKIVPLVDVVRTTMHFTKQQVTYEENIRYD